MQIDTPIAILVAASFATMGWLWTGRRMRALSRKQHTFTVLFQSSLNEVHMDAVKAITPHIRIFTCPDLNAEENKIVAMAFRKILNHYEFIAAAIRNGDFDERLFRDTERATILGVFETCEKYIYAVRTDRRRQTIYEHLEWLHRRWEGKPPGRIQYCIEWLHGRPLPGRRVKPEPLTRPHS